MIIQLTNGVPSSNPILETNFRQLFPDTSFPRILTPEVLEPFGYGLYQLTQQPTLQRYEKAVEGTPTKNEVGIWVQTWTVEPMTTEEQQVTNDNKANEVRAERNFKLSLSDWTQLADSPVDPQLWTTYRQALRDVPTQQGFPWDITWPTEPTN